jgi:methyl halide transferase
MPLTLRPSWALRMSELLSPSGRLVCLEFPLYKSAELGGPPFAVRKETYERHLTKPGEDLKYNNGMVVDDGDKTPNAKGLVCLDRWKPERTHQVGEGHDHISVWGHP